MKFNIRKLFIYLLFFYIIYTPSTSSFILFDKNITIPIITLIMGLYYLICNRYKEFKINKILFLFVILITISNCYYLFIYILNNNVLSVVDSRIIQNNLVLCYLVIISVIFSILKKSNYTKNDILNIVINLAVFQGLICALMVLIPNLHNIALSFYYKGAEENIFISTSRIYGISSDYTYATPIYHAFIAGIAFYKYLVNNGKNNLLKCVIISISILLNGRTGLIILLFLVAYYLITYCFKNKKFFKLIKGISICIVVIFASILLLKSFLPSTYNFIHLMAVDTINLVQNDEYDGNYGILKNSMHFPKGDGLIFGEGFRVFGSEGISRGYIPSDIGYINDIHMGGIIYCIFLYGAFIYLIGRLLKKSPIKIPLYITLFIANFKGEAFHSSILAFLVIFLCLLEVYNEKKSNYSNSNL